MSTPLAFLAVSSSVGGNGESQLPAADDAFATRRREMVRTQIEARGIRDPAVLEALRHVPRERFVPEAERSHAYDDGPLVLEAGQTISQPYIVALMTELIRPTRSMKVLEVGTGSGYQTAVLAECVGDVYTIEILPGLALRAQELLRTQGYRNVQLRIGDGYDGWPEAAPFDAILVTAAPGDVPEPLLEQLRFGGTLVIPVGSESQELLRVTRTAHATEREFMAPVRFVPMTGKARKT